MINEYCDQIVEYLIQNRLYFDINLLSRLSKSDFTEIFTVIQHKSYIGEFQDQAPPPLLPDETHVDLIFTYFTSEGPFENSGH